MAHFYEKISLFSNVSSLQLQENFYSIGPWIFLLHPSLLLSSIL